MGIKTKFCSVLLLMLMTIFQARADEPTVALIMELVDGTLQEYFIGEDPRVTFDEDNVYIKSLLVETEVPKSRVERFFFDWRNTPPTAINEVSKPVGASFSYDGSTASLTGAGPWVQVYDLGGRLLCDMPTIDGAATISVTSFGAGIYIIKTTTQSFKILKK